MGGQLSCMHAGASSANPEQACSPGSLTLVLVCEGRTCELPGPVKVAELMLEFPNHFVAEYDMHIQTFEGRSSYYSSGVAVAVAVAMAAGPACRKRVVPLPADHDAKLCHVYLLLPMHRLNTRLSADEIALIPALIATAAPACTTGHLSYAKTSTVTPLSGRHFQVAGTTRRAAAKASPSFCSSSSNVAIVKSYSVPILELVGDASASIAKDSEPHSCANSLQELHIPRSKSWTPKLETILESHF